MKNYQTTARRAGTTGRTTAKKAEHDAGRAAVEAALVLPDTVSVVLGDLAGELQEGLLAFVVGAGLKVVQTMMDHEVETLAGPKGRHDPGRVAVRHGRDDGLVTLGGRQVPISRPRVRSADRTSEVALATYDCFASTELLGRWRWRRCWPRSPRGATTPVLSRSVRRWKRRAEGRRVPPFPDGS